MSAEPAHAPDRLELLTFWRCGVSMAADVEQVEEIPVRDLLVLRGAREPRAVEIDLLGELVTVPVDAVQPLPALVAACAGARPYWGAVVLAGSPVLLVDLFELECP